MAANEGGEVLLFDQPKSPGKSTQYPARPASHGRRWGNWGAPLWPTAAKRFLHRKSTKAICVWGGSWLVASVPFLFCTSGLATEVALDWWPWNKCCLRAACRSRAWNEPESGGGQCALGCCCRNEPHRCAAVWCSVHCPVQLQKWATQLSGWAPLHHTTTTTLPIGCCGTTPPIG